MNFNKKFECKLCGRCCKNLRGKIDIEGLEDKHNQIIKLGVYPLINSKTITFPIYSWERFRIMKESIKFGIKFKLKPSLTIFDRISKNILVFTWDLDHNNCPFLNTKNKCKIYKVRPLTCKSFPIDLGSNRMRIEFCPNRIKINFGNDSKINANLITEIYGDNYYYAYLQEIANKRILDFIKNLEKKSIIGMEYGRPLKFIKKYAQRKKPIDLLEFLVTKGSITNNQIEELNFFYDNVDQVKNNINFYFSGITIDDD